MHNCTRCTCVYKRAHVYVPACIHACMHTPIRNTYVYISPAEDVPVCTSARTYMCCARICACLHACMHAGIHAYTHACIHQYETHTYTYLQQKMYLCMQARARTHTLTRLAHQRKEVCRIIRNAMHNCIRYTHTYTHFYQVYTCTCTHFYQAYTCIFKTGRDVSHTSHTHTLSLSLNAIHILSTYFSPLVC